MPEPNDTNTAITAGVAQALERMFGSNDADSRFFDAVRLGCRDALWLIAANARPTPMPASDPPVMPTDHVGRPSKFSDELARMICLRMAEGGEFAEKSVVMKVCRTGPP